MFTLLQAMKNEEIFSKNLNCKSQTPNKTFTSQFSETGPNPPTTSQTYTYTHTTKNAKLKSSKSKQCCNINTSSDRSWCCMEQNLNHCEQWFDFYADFTKTKHAVLLILLETIELWKKCNNNKFVQVNTISL